MAMTEYEQAQVQALAAIAQQLKRQNDLQEQAMNFTPPDPTPEEIQLQQLRVQAEIAQLQEQLAQDNTELDKEVRIGYYVRDLTNMVMEGSVEASDIPQEVRQKVGRYLQKRDPDLFERLKAQLSGEQQGVTP